jgi:hypothetical protein
MQRRKKKGFSLLRTQGKDFSIFSWRLGGSNIFLSLHLCVDAFALAPLFSRPNHPKGLPVSMGAETVFPLK